MASQPYDDGSQDPGVSSTLAFQDLDLDPDTQGSQYDYPDFTLPSQSQTQTQTQATQPSAGGHGHSSQDHFTSQEAFLSRPYQPLDSAAAAASFRAATATVAAAAASSGAYSFVPVLVESWLDLVAVHCAHAWCLSSHIGQAR